MRKLAFLCLLVLAALPSSAELPNVHAMCTCPCPDSPPWVKVEGLTSTSYTYTPPACKKVTKVCYKSSTTCRDYLVTPACGAPVTVTSTVYNNNGERQALSHASFYLVDCECPTPTPTPTPTPPPPTPTPTPTPPTPTPTPTPTPPPCVPDEEPQCGEVDCGKTLYWGACIEGVKVQTSKVCDPCPCVPKTECDDWQCGSVPDGCGGSITCGRLCPPPQPPPGEWPDPVCDECYFPVSLVARNWKGENSYHAQAFNFRRAYVSKLLIVEGLEDTNYQLVVAPTFDPNDPKAKTLYEFRGPGVVTVPFPKAGLPLQQYSYLFLVGGEGRVTLWLPDAALVYVKTLDYYIQTTQ